MADEFENEEGLDLESMGGVSENLASSGKKRKSARAKKAKAKVQEEVEEEEEGEEGKKKARLSNAEKVRAASLEDELFGRASFAPDDEDQDDENEKATTSGDTETPLFVIDTAGGSAGDLVAAGEAAGGEVEASGARKPAWVDEGEEDVTVGIAGESRRRKLRRDVAETEVGGEVFSERLRDKYRELSGPRSHAWAALKPRGAEREAPSDAILRRSGTLLAPRGASLLPKVIEATRVKDANVTEPSASVLQAIEFHPKSLLMITAGFDKMLRVFDVDGVKNPKVRAAFFEDLPIRRAKFVDDATVLCAGRRPYCYKYNVETGAVSRIPQVSGMEGSSLENFSVGKDLRCVSFLGRNGEVCLVSSKTNRKVAELRVDHRATCAAFASDRELAVTNSVGEVTRWDLRTYRCLDRFSDEGNLKATALAAGSGYWAVGSESGVCNVYAGQLGGSGPKKAVMNLTTKCDHLSFAPSGELLAISSSMKRDALRLVHLPTCTTYQNWPTSKTPLHYVHCTAFSPQSGYLAVGNARGKCLLYRLGHYPEA